MRSTVTKSRCDLAFDSVADLVDAAMGCFAGVRARDAEMAGMAAWHGGVSSMAELAAIARAGLSADGIEAASIAEDRVQVMDRELPLPSFSTFYDVSGADVDVARYLSGEPECMINFDMVDTPRVGRVITLVAFVGTPGMVSASAIARRGREIVSLIFAIERMGFQVELWADDISEGGGKSGRVRVKVKEPGGVLDPGEIMFAFTHPGMPRGLVLAAMHLFPAEFQGPIGIGHGYGQVPIVVDLDEYPEGSILIPPLTNNGAVDLVRDTLRKLGLVP